MTEQPTLESLQEKLEESHQTIKKLKKLVPPDPSDEDIQKNVLDWLKENAPPEVQTVLYQLIEDFNLSLSSIELEERIVQDAIREKKELQQKLNEKDQQLETVLKSKSFLGRLYQRLAKMKTAQAELFERKYIEERDRNVELLKEIRHLKGEEA